METGQKVSHVWKGGGGGRIHESYFGAKKENKGREMWKIDNYTQQRRE